MTGCQHEERSKPFCPALAVIVIATAGALISSGCRPHQESQQGNQPATAAPSGERSPVRVVYPAAPGSFVELSRELAPSVVHLRSTSPVTGGPATLFPGAADADHALGSGFVVEVEKRLLVITNDHIISAAPELRVVLSDGTTVSGNVVGRDPKLDIALIEVEATPKLRPARLGRSESLQVGEWVLALGNPFGAEVTASSGIISSLGQVDRNALVGNERVSPQAFLQTDAVIHAGNSGGPLVNMAGEVVGINVAVDHHAQRRGVGFAVPADHTRDLLPMLAKDGVVSRAWLGLKVLPVDASTAARLGREPNQGALVSQVIPGGPAARAGIERGDVILRYGDRDVTHRTLPWMVASAGLEARRVVVWRNGGERILTVAPEKMPD